MICKNCNVHVEDGSAVCPVCGGEVEPETALEETASEVTSVKETVPETTAEVPVPAKRKTWVKVAAIVACVALFLGLAASVWYGVNGGFAPRANNVSYKDQYYAEKDKAVKAADDVIATVGDKGLTNGQFQVFYWMNIYEFCNQYSDYLSYFGLDLTMPLYEQYAEEDSTWEQFFIDSTLNTWHSYQSLLLYAQEDGSVRFMSLGVAAQTLPAQEVHILCEDGPVYGVIGAVPPHLTGEDDRDRVTPVEELFIDTGLAYDEVVCRVKPGTPVQLVGRTMMLENDYMVSKTMDDRACVATMIECAEHRKNRKRSALPFLFLLKQPLAVDAPLVKSIPMLHPLPIIGSCDGMVERKSKRCAALYQLRAPSHIVDGKRDLGRILKNLRFHSCTRADLPRKMRDGNVIPIKSLHCDLGFGRALSFPFTLKNVKRTKKLAEHLPARVLKK